MNPSLDCKQIQGILMQSLYANHPVMCPNFSGAHYDESDVLAISNTHYVKEYEIKISRSDFKADFKKVAKHSRYKKRMNTAWPKTPNKFFYVCPENLISVDEIPEYAGLIYIVTNPYSYPSGQLTTHTVKEAPYLHKDKAELKVIERLAQGAVAKMIWGKSYLTYQNEQYRLLSNKEYDEYNRIKNERRTLTEEQWQEWREWQLEKKLAERQLLPNL